MKRDNWTNEEVIEILEGMKIVGRDGKSKDSEGNFALDCAITRFWDFIPVIIFIIMSVIIVTIVDPILRTRSESETPYYTTNPFNKHLNNAEGERIHNEFALLPDFKKKKVEDICINYLTAKLQDPFDANLSWQTRGVPELYTKFGSFDAIIEHFQLSEKD